MNWLYPQIEVPLKFLKYKCIPSIRLIFLALDGEHGLTYHVSTHSPTRHDH